MLYQVIYADPPWRYDSAPPGSEIERHYNTMDLESICAMQVPADPHGCALFLWATSPLIPYALEVMMAWRFKYKTSLIWDKERAGLGYWFRIQHELLMVGTRGYFSPPAPSSRIPSVVRVPRGTHSTKPAVIRDLIASWYPEARKLEMFARESHLGWDTFGDEVAPTLFDQQPREVAL